MDEPAAFNRTQQPYIACRLCEQPIDLASAVAMSPEDLTDPFAVRCPHCQAQGLYSTADIVSPPVLDR